MKKSVLLIMMLFFSSFVQASTTTLVNTSPVVAITSPANQNTFTADSNITITAAASETGGTISTVSFYNGSTLLGTSSASPYSYIWSNVPAGSYKLTAKATDVNAATTTSSPVTITITAPIVPVVTISGPANHSTFTAGSNIILAASASESNGTIANVSFYSGSTLLMTSNTSSCNYTWADVSAGTYTLTAKATDTKGVSTTSSAVTVTVTAASASAPVIAITSPADQSAFTAGSDITITATASESNGTIREVFFYDRTYYLGSSTVPPYTYTWTNVPAGTYCLSVEATDSNGGTLISESINITVNPTTSSVITPLVGLGKKK